MSYDDRKRDDIDSFESYELDDLDNGEAGARETLRASDSTDVSSPGNENVDQGGRRPQKNAGSQSAGSESERSDRTHQAPHEDHVGRADWAVEGSEGGGDPGGLPRRGGSGAGSRRKNKE
jgi:hypothetical protein